MFNFKNCQLTHRPPQGPNEDIGACSCGMPAFAPRPKNETIGWHADDCSLDIDHPGYCVGGGKGHKIPKGHTIRG